MGNFEGETRGFVEGILATLERKAKEYATETERFWNFQEGREIFGRFISVPLTEEQVLLAYMTKHLTAVFDMVSSQEAPPDFKWIEEHVGDVIAYLLLLAGMMREKVKEKEHTITVNFEEEEEEFGKYVKGTEKDD
jgi:NTP pyrophosphatase (non-canonical NTP hydrolase)